MKKDTDTDQVGNDGLIARVQGMISGETVVIQKLRQELNGDDRLAAAIAGHLLYREGLIISNLGSAGLRMIAEIEDAAANAKVVDAEQLRRASSLTRCGFPSGFDTETWKFGYRGREIRILPYLYAWYAFSLKNPLFIWDFRRGKEIPQMLRMAEHTVPMFRALIEGLKMRILFNWTPSFDQSLGVFLSLIDHIYFNAKTFAAESRIQLPWEELSKVLELRGERGVRISLTQPLLERVMEKLYDLEPFLAGYLFGRALEPLPKIREETLSPLFESGWVDGLAQNIKFVDCIEDLVRYKESDDLLFRWALRENWKTMGLTSSSALVLKLESLSMSARYGTWEEAADDISDCPYSGRPTTDEAEDGRKRLLARLSCDAAKKRTS